MPTTFEARAHELTTELPGHVPTVQPEEAAAIRAAHPDDVDAIAALEALARPRLAYSWQQAGGQARPPFTLTPAEREAARTHYAAERAAQISAVRSKPRPPQSPPPRTPATDTTNSGAPRPAGGDAGGSRVGETRA